MKWASVLKTARDTRALGVMRAAEYSYKGDVEGQVGNFRGQVQTIKHLDSGALVSSFTCNSFLWDDAATNSETRGDGPSRQIRIAKGASDVPLVQWKEDYKGVKEYFL